MDKSIKKLLQQNFIQEEEQRSDTYFMLPILITVKKDLIVGEASVGTKEVNEEVHKKLYQIANIEKLMDFVRQTISEQSPHGPHLGVSAIDFEYRY